MLRGRVGPKLLRMDKSMPPQKEVAVWDRLQRTLHWTLAIAFFTAYFSAEESEDVHVIAGYVVAGCVALRLVWGFVGSPHARFANFLRGPREIFGYLSGLARGTARRFIGHNPAGGAMVIAILLALAGTALTGMAVEADTENEGPLAALLGHPVAAPATSAADSGEEHERPESAYEEVHEGFANVTLALVVLHLLGVLASSLAHRENLPRAMLTGRKRAPEPTQNL